MRRLRARHRGARAPGAQRSRGRAISGCVLAGALLASGSCSSGTTPTDDGACPLVDGVELPFDVVTRTGFVERRDVLGCSLKGLGPGNEVQVYAHRAPSPEEASALTNSFLSDHDGSLSWDTVKFAVADVVVVVQWMDVAVPAAQRTEMLKTVMANAASLDLDFEASAAAISSVPLEPSQVVSAGVSLSVDQRDDDTTCWEVRAGSSPIRSGCYSGDLFEPDGPPVTMLFSDWYEDEALVVAAIAPPYTATNVLPEQSVRWGDAPDGWLVVAGAGFDLELVLQSGSDVLVCRASLRAICRVG